MLRKRLKALQAEQSGTRAHSRTRAHQRSAAGRYGICRLHMPIRGL